MDKFYRIDSSTDDMAAGLFISEQRRKVIIKQLMKTVVKYKDRSFEVGYFDGAHFTEECLAMTENIQEAIFVAIKAGGILQAEQALQNRSDDKAPDPDDAFKL